MLAGLPSDGAGVVPRIRPKLRVGVHACRSRSYLAALILVNLPFTGAGVVPRVRPSDVLIRSYIGSMGFTTQTDWVYAEKETGERVKPSPLDALNPSRTTEESGATVRFFSGQSRDGGRLLLKEFSASASSLATAERMAFERLITIGRARASVGSGASLAPIPQLVGYMESGQAFESPDFRSEWRANMRCDPPVPGALWLIFVWEGLRTAAGWPVAVRRARESEPPPGALARLAALLDGGPERAAARAASEAAARRAVFATALVRGMLQAVAAVHAAGVAHRGIGPACFGVSTLDEGEAAALRVRIDNFGFSLSVSQAAQDSALVRRAVLARTERPDDGAKSGGSAGLQPSAAELSALLERDDLRALGYSVLEVLLAVAESGATVPPAGAAPAPTPASARAGMEQATLRRLIEDVFVGDMARFREYCAADARWAEAVALLDRSSGGGAAGGATPSKDEGKADALGAGWRLLGELLSNGSDAQAIAIAAECGELRLAQRLLDQCEWLGPAPPRRTG